MKKKANVLKRFRVSSKDLNLNCHPESEYAFVCWHALFSQLEIQQREFTFRLLSDAHCEIPIIPTGFENTYLFSSHFTGVYAHFHNASLNFKFKGYHDFNFNKISITSLKEVLSLLQSKQFKFLSKLDVIANYMNNHYTSSQLQQVFGHHQLSLKILRDISGLSIKQTPKTLSYSSLNSSFSLDNILNSLEDEK